MRGEVRSPRTSACLVCARGCSHVTPCQPVGVARHVRVRSCAVRYARRARARAWCATSCRAPRVCFSCAGDVGFASVVVDVGRAVGLHHAPLCTLGCGTVLALRRMYMVRMCACVSWLATRGSGAPGGVTSYIRCGRREASSGGCEPSLRAVPGPMCDTLLARMAMCA